VTEAALYAQSRYVTVKQPLACQCDATTTAPPITRNVNVFEISTFISY